MTIPRTNRVPASIQDSIEKILDAGAQVPHLSELVERFYEMVGGPRGFAQLLHEEWLAAKPGSMQRARIMEMILRMHGSIKDLTTKDELGFLSEDDLVREMYACLGQAEELNETQP